MIQNKEVEVTKVSEVGPTLEEDHDQACQKKLKPIIAMEVTKV